MKRTVRQEILYQLYTQPLHVLMGIVSVLATGAILLVTKAAAALEGLAQAADLEFGALAIATAAATGFTLAWEAGREISQWPSSRWWDPPLDYAFELAGLVLGAWLFYSVVGPLLG